MQQSNKNKRVISKPTSAPPKGMAPAPPKLISSKNAANDSNRGLTVIIPRAKYYSQQTGNGPPLDMPQHHQHYERYATINFLSILFQQSRVS